MVGNDYSAMSDWFFQMVFVGTTASIVSGTLAERVKLWSFFLFIAIMTAIIYPLVGAWTWGGGLAERTGIQRFRGIDHRPLDRRLGCAGRGDNRRPAEGKFRKDGTVKPTPPSNVPAVTLGVFILWLGWFGFNGGSQLALGGVADAIAISNILVNTNLAAAGGVMIALCLSRPILGRIDLLSALNGGIAGLVAITAAPDITAQYWAIPIGAGGSVVCLLGTKMLESMKIDDVVGAVPAHLLAGIWGTLAVCIAGGGNVLAQLAGIGAVAVFVFGASLLAWFAIDKTIGARVSTSVEDLGQDTAELGIESYPEFVLLPEMDDE